MLKWVEKGFICHSRLSTNSVPSTYDLHLRTACEPCENAWWECACVPVENNQIYVTFYYASHIHHFHQVVDFHRFAASQAAYIFIVPSGDVFFERRHPSPICAALSIEHRDRSILITYTMHISSHITTHPHSSLSGISVTIRNVTSLYPIKCAAERNTIARRNWVSKKLIERSNLGVKCINHKNVEWTCL